MTKSKAQVEREERAYREQYEAAIQRAVDAIFPLSPEQIARVAPILHATGFFSIATPADEASSESDAVA